MQIQGNQQIAQPGFDNVDNNSAAEPLAGKASNGEKVLVRTNTASPMQKASDLAEELAQYVKDNKKDFKDLKVKKGTEFTEGMQKRVEKIQTLQNVQEIKDFLQQLKSNPDLTREQLEEKLKDAFGDDVVHEFMGLDSAVRFFDDIGDKEKADMLKGVRNEFFAENKVALQSALNVSEVAAQESEEKGFSSTKGLRETHVKLLDHVRDNPSLEVSYDKLLDSHSSGNFKIAVEIQAKLASTDMLSFNPSTSPERLKAVIDDLAELKVLVGLHDGCVETEEQLARIFPETSIEERALMKMMLSLLNLPMVTESDFSKLPDKLNVSELEAQIFTMTKAVHLVRMLPEEIFTNIESKQNMLAAAMESLDYLIEQENEEEIGEVGDAGDGGFGILGDLKSAKTVPGTADHIAAKVLKQIPGEEYASLAEIIGDIQKLAGKPAELQALLNMIEEVNDPSAEHADDLKQVKDYANDLLDISTPKSGLHSTNSKSTMVGGS